MTLRILAALITAALFWARPSAAEECPSPARIDAHTWLAHDCWVAGVNADFEAARVLVEEARSARDAARQERDACHLAAAGALEECAAAIPPPAPDNGPLWAWTVAGAAAIGVPVGLCQLGVECGPGYAPWLAGAVSVGIVALVGWWVD